MRRLSRLFGSSKNNKPSEPTPSSSPNDEKSGDGIIENFDEDAMVAEIFEYERWNARLGWNYLNLAVDSDPKHFSSTAGSSDRFPNPHLADGWEYMGQWEIDRAVEGCDSDGWRYGIHFDDFDKGRPTGNMKARSPDFQFIVRCRRWIRAVQLRPPEDPNEISLNQKEYLSQFSEIEGGFEEDDETSTQTSDKIETSSLDGSDIDPTEKTSRASTILGRGSILGTSPQSFDPNLRIRDMNIVNTGKQIKGFESQHQAMEDSELKEWNKSHKPILGSQIIELEKKVNAMRMRLEAEVLNHGLDSVKGLEDELKILVDALEDCKKRYHLPYSPIVLGQGGIYLGFDDIWIENISGHFLLDLVPSSDTPQINLVLTGTENKSESGINVRLQLDGFKMVGDRGKSIPKLKMETVKVTLTLRISFCFNFDVKSNSWKSSPKTFKLDLINFRGPYGISKSIVGMVLSLVTPMIRTKMLAGIPPEVGYFIRYLPSPFCVRGEFDINGPELDIISTPMEKCPIMADLCGFNSFQMEMFVWMQKSMERGTPIRTMGQLLQYYRKYSKNQDIWGNLVRLWNQAAKQYSEKYFKLKSETNQFYVQDNSISFNAFLVAVEEMRRKRMSADFKLQHVDGQFSINQTLKYLHLMLSRLASESISKSTGVKQARLMMMLEKIQSSYDIAQERMSIISTNIDSAQLKIGVDLDAGPDGTLKVLARDILAQAPITIDLAIDKEKNIGHPPLVPFIMSFKPQDNGDIYFEMYHFSKEGLEHSQPGQYKTQGLASSTHRYRNGNAVACDEEHEIDESTAIYEGNEESSTVFSEESDVLPGLNSETKSRSMASAVMGMHRTFFRRNSLSSSNVQTNASVHGTNGTNMNGNNSNPTTPSKGISSSSSLAPVTSNDGSKLEFVENASQILKNIGLSLPGRKNANSHGNVYYTNSRIRTAESLRRELQETLSKMPSGDTADVILVVNVNKPNLSMIIDHDVSLTAGSELFTFMLGPRDQSTKIESQEMQTTSKVGVGKGKGQEEASEGIGNEDKEEPTRKGCPILVKTSPGVKFLAKVPRGEMTVNLPALVRFIGSHFADMGKLLIFLQKFFGGGFYFEQLETGKLILDKFSKYFLLPGLNLHINLNGKLVAMNNEILVSVTTPDSSEIVQDRIHQQYHMRNESISRSGIHGLLSGKSSLSALSMETPCAINIHAELNLMDLFEDSLAIEQSFRMALEGMKNGANNIFNNGNGNGNSTSSSP